MDILTEAEMKNAVEIAALKLLYTVTDEMQKYRSEIDVIQSLLDTGFTEDDIKETIISIFVDRADNE